MSKVFKMGRYSLPLQKILFAVIDSEGSAYTRNFTSSIIQGIARTRNAEMESLCCLRDLWVSMYSETVVKQ